MELVRRTQLLPTCIGGIEAWQAYVDGVGVTVVRSRPDIVARHLAGDLYGSNIAALVADLEDIEQRPLAEDELALREIRRDGDAISLGLFDPIDGWMLRDLLPYTHVDRELAAAVALAIYRTYSGGPTMITRDGNLQRRTLPMFERIWEYEMPSFIGTEPEISEGGRRDELCALYVRLGGEPADVARTGPRPRWTDDVTDPAPAIEVAALEAIAHPDPGPALVRALRLDEV